jgi:hypothetical protein
MTDEWRVSVSLLKRSRGLRGLRGKESSLGQTAMSTLRSRVGSDIRVSPTSEGVFLYAASADAAMQAEQVVREVLAQHGVDAVVRRDRWDPINKSWEDPAAEPPEDSEEALREARDLRMDSERERSAATGRAAWQVRVEPASHDEVTALARRLEAEGLPVVRRWKYLITGAACEDDAHALADTIRGYSSVGTLVRVQPGVYGLPGTGADLGPPGGF